MSTRFSARDLAQAVKLTRRACVGRGTIPVLSMLRLTKARQENHARITATDLDIQISVRIDAEGGALECMAHPDALTDILRGEDGPATITQTPDQISVDVGACRTSWRPVVPVEDFPAMVFKSLPEAQEVSQDVLRDMLRLTGFAISTEETRYYLNGLFIDTKEAPLAIATDGYRLARFRLPEDLTRLKSAIIPHAAMAPLADMLRQGGNTPALIQIGETQGRVVVADHILNFKMIDGKYPDWRRVVHGAMGQDAFQATISADTLAKFGPAAHREPARLTPDEGALSVQYFNSAGDKLETRVPLTGRGAERGFKVRYLKDMCKAANGPVTLKAGSAPGDPALCLTEDPRADFVLMPMRI